MLRSIRTYLNFIVSSYALIHVYVTANVSRDIGERQFMEFYRFFYMMTIHFMFGACSHGLGLKTKETFENTLDLTSLQTGIQKSRELHCWIIGLCLELSVCQLTPLSTTLAVSPSLLN